MLVLTEKRSKLEHPELQSIASKEAWKAPLFHIRRVEKPALSRVDNSGTEVSGSGSWAGPSQASTG